MIKLLSNFSVATKMDKNFILKDLSLDDSKKIYIIRVVFEHLDLTPADFLINKNLITFMGNLAYYPNYEGINYFLKNIWPEINKTFPDLKFYIIGQGEKKLKNKFKKLRNVIFTGFLENPYEIIQKSLCFISPVRIGAGIQGKVIGAMSLGKVVIVYSNKQEDEEFINYNNILMCKNNSKEEWINLIKWVMEHQREARVIGENSKKLVEGKFSSNIISNVYKNAFKEIIEHTTNIKNA
jgi:glycosyltransferase involved in cell wall biosynthesis